MTSRSALGLSLIVVVVALGAVVGFQALTGSDSQDRELATASYLAALPGEAVPSGSVYEVDIVAAPAVAEFSDDLSVEVMLERSGSTPITVAANKSSVGFTEVWLSSTRQSRPMTVTWCG